jgi:hypothetical protein
MRLSRALFKKSKESTSFCEQKEAKKLLYLGASASAISRPLPRATSDQMESFDRKSL